MEESLQETYQDVGKHALRLVLQVARGYISLWGRKSSTFQPGAERCPPAPGSPLGPWLDAAGVGAGAAACNCWMHYYLCGPGDAEHMADIGKMPDCLVAAGSSFKFHSFFM